MIRLEEAAPARVTKQNVNRTWTNEDLSNGWFDVRARSVVFAVQVARGISCGVLGQNAQRLT